jgi:hypothetical protein
MIETDYKLILFSHLLLPHYFPYFMTNSGQAINIGSIPGKEEVFFSSPKCANWLWEPTRPPC